MAVAALAPVLTALKGIKGWQWLVGLLTAQQAMGTYHKGKQIGTERMVAKETLAMQKAQIQANLKGTRMAAKEKRAMSRELRTETAKLRREDRRERMQAEERRTEQTNAAAQNMMMMQMIQ